MNSLINLIVLDDYFVDEVVPHWLSQPFPGGKRWGLQGVRGALPLFSWFKPQWRYHTTLVGKGIDVWRASTFRRRVYEIFSSLCHLFSSSPLSQPLSLLNDCSLNISEIKEGLSQEKISTVAYASLSLSSNLCAFWGWKSKDPVWKLRSKGFFALSRWIEWNVKRDEVKSCSDSRSGFFKQFERFSKIARSHLRLWGAIRLSLEVAYLAWEHSSRARQS